MNNDLPSSTPEHNPQGHRRGRGGAAMTPAPWKLHTCLPPVHPAVEPIADEIRHRAGCEFGPPRDMAEVARRLGFRLHIVPCIGGPMGLLFGPDIFVLNTLPPGMTAHVIAHELAHAVNDEWGHVIPDKPEDYMETQMDLVAAAVLMPRPWIHMNILQGRTYVDLIRQSGCIATVGGVFLAHVEQPGAVDAFKPPADSVRGS